METCDALMKWSHSILYEKNFMSEWQAYDSAIALSFQLGSWQQSLSAVQPESPFQHDTVNHRSANFVSFEQDVEIAFFSPDDDDLFYQPHSTSMTLTSLASWTHAEGKPWSSRRTRSKKNKSFPFSSATSESSVSMTSNTDLSQRHQPPRAGPVPAQDQSWQDTVWELLQTEGRPDTDAEDPVIFLKSYFINHVGHQHSGPPRPIRCSTDYTNWERDARFVWEDLAVAHLPIDLVFVRPQPPALQASAMIATVIIHQNPVPPRVPCLVTAVFIDDPRTWTFEMAHSVTPLLTFEEVLQLGDAAETCRAREQDGSDPCTLHVGFRLLPRDQAIVVEEGMGITTRVPSRLSAEEAEQNLVARVQRLRAVQARHEWNDDEAENPEGAHPASAASGTRENQPEDATSFMARSLQSFRGTSDGGTSSSSSSNDVGTAAMSLHQDDKESFLTVIFSLDGQERQIDAPWDNADLLWELTAVQFELSIDDVVSLHHVDHRPADIEQNDLECLLLQRRQDAPSADFLRLCLLDIEYKADARGPQLRIDRRPIWIPRRINRASVIRLAGFDGFCALSPHRCDVWINGIPLEVGEEVHDVQHGDYIRIAVPSHPDDPDSGCMVDTHDQPYIHVDDDLMSLGQINVHHTRAVLQDITNVHEASQRKCRLPTGSECEGDTFVTPLFPPEEPGRPELQFGEHLECLDALHRTWTMHAAVERADEGRILYISTWFSDCERWPECETSRPVRLLPDFGQWADAIAEAWDDRLDPDSPVHLYLITPQPRSSLWMPEVLPHVLVLQNPVAHLKSIHIATLNSGRGDHNMHGGIRTVSTQFWRSHILEAAGILRSCRPGHVDCMVWWGELELRDGQQYQARHGFSFLIIRNNLADISASSNAPQVAMTAETEGTALLQTCLRKVKTKIVLDELIPEEITETTPMPVRLIAGAPMAPLPTYVECSEPCSSIEICNELRHWGHDCDVYKFDAHDVALCLPKDWQKPADIFHYMFCNVETSDTNGAFMHSSDKQLTTVDIMSFLYLCGYWRATVLDLKLLECGIFQVIFEDVVVQVSSVIPPTKQAPDWPTPISPKDNVGPFFLVPTAVADTDCVIDYGLNLQEIIEFFSSANDMLCRNPEGYQFPDTTLAALRISASTNLADFDRIIIYTDGSSHAKAKHKPALWNAEHGHGDTWAFVVIGEKFGPNDFHTVEVLGWTAQEVHYDCQSAHFLGAEYLGSHIAEREALTWAGLWRLAQNIQTPTIFRSDSQISSRQATGEIGSSDSTASFQCFRGVFQALETALPDHCLCVEHIPSHCGEPFNDLVDWLASSERQKSFHFPRQALSMQRWRPFLPHFWTLLSHSDGMPSVCATGLHAPAPDLPLLEESTGISNSPAGATSSHQVLDLCVSMGSANVASMYNGEWGHAGKTLYLRQQFQAMRLLFLGLQETRTPETFSTADGVVRFGSGHEEGGLYGVELWVNLQVPFGHLGGRPLFLQVADMQVLYRDPRLLMVRVVNNHIQWAIIVGYAPQSGLDEAQRADWWVHLSQIVSQKKPDDRLFMMIDANADPGSRDDIVVHQDGFKTTANTHLFRNFLSVHGLTLPATCSIHDGTTTTWRSPNGMHEHCIDHLVIDHELLASCTFSGVLEDFDLGTGMYDHVAVGLQLEWKQVLLAPRGPRSRPKIHAAGCDHDKVQHGHVRAVLESYHTVAWNCDVEQHVADFNQHLLTGLASLCPKSKAKPKKKFITDDVWHLRICKLERRKALKELTLRHKFELLSACFSALSKDKKPDPAAFWKYDTWLMCCRVRLICGLHRASKQLRDRLKLAKHDQLRKVFQHLSPSASASTILHELRQIIGSTNLRKCTRKALPFIKDEHGQVCGSPTEALDTWIRFFQTMEGGKRIPAQQQREEWIANLQHFQASSLDLSLMDLPSLSDLESAYRRVAPGKATGPDGVPATVCHRGPAMLARKTYALLLKTITHGQESLLHKGGRLHPLWKGKGAKDRCVSYRSILVSSHIGKSLHRCLRVHSSELFEKYLQRQQLGGKRRIAVGLGVHQARAYLRSRRARGLNVGMIFLDLCEAFYRIVRELAIGGPANDIVIAQMGARLGMSTDLLHELYKHLDDDHALARAGMNPQWQQAVRSLHTDTHFSLYGQDDACKTQLGTRPGDSWADLIFSFLWAPLLHDFEAEVTRLGLIDTVPEAHGFQCSALPCTFEPQTEPVRSPFLGPTWMDDSAFCFADSDASQLERKAGQICSLLLQKCAEFAMTPNLAPGKTAILLTFQGKGSVEARKRNFGPTAPKTLPVLTSEGAVNIHLVPCYTHLGCLLHHKGDMRQEVRKRFSIAQTAFQQHRRILDQNKHLSLKRRAELCRTLILSKFVYGCESWTLRDAKTRHALHTSLIKLYKRLLPGQSAQQSRDAEVLNVTGLPDPSDLLRIQRLRHLGALYAAGETTSWGLLNEDTEWTTLVCSDLEWMWTQLCASSELPDPKHHFPAWTYLMKYHRKYWKKLIVRAGAHAAAQRDLLYEVRAFHRNALGALQDHDQIVHPPPARVTDFTAEIFGCFACEKRFSSRGGCGAHMFRVHGVTQAVRHLFEGTQCGSCLREFHSHGKLQLHLMRAEFCRHSLQRRGVRFAPAPGIGSTTNTRLERVHDQLLPPLQAQGPKLEHGHRALADDYDLQLFEDIYETLLESTGIQDAYRRTRMCVQGRPLSWEVVQKTLRHLGDAATEQDVSVLPFDLKQFRELFRHLALHTSWDFLVEESKKEQGHWHHEAHVLIECCALEAQARRDGALPAPPVPRGFSAERYFLHLFSGRRRRGDFQFFFDQFQAPEGIWIQVISLDVVLSEVWGDLLRPATRAFWKSAIRARIVIGLLGGPPCETWSKARERAVDDRRRAPRVLRTAEHPWGKEALSLREVTQVRVGNVLMGFQLEAVIDLYCTGGVAVTEHPAAPDNEDSVSIWRTSLVALLQALPGFQLITLAQGLWGAKSPKPTSLLALNAPHLVQILRQWQIAQKVPMSVSIGRDNQGNWSTSVLKEYPPALNAALAQGLHEAILSCTTDSTVQVADSFKAKCTSMLCTEYGGALGPDFAG